MVQKIFNLIKSYVTFEISDGFCDEFLTLCRDAGIKIFDIKRNPPLTLCRVYAGDYSKLRKIARKSGVKIRLLKKRGLRFFIFRNRYRAGLLLGAVLFTVILSLLSGRIWDIEIIGNKTVTDGEIFEVLDDFGINTGCKKNSVDNVNIRQDFMIRLPKISWASFNINGSVLTLEIDEKTDAPEVLDERVPCNICSDYDAIIEEIEAYKGTGAVVPGSAVRKGDILVSGITEYSNGMTALSHSKARITGITEEELSFEIPLSETALVRTGESKTVRVLNLYGLKIPLYTALPDYEYFEKETDKKSLSAAGKTAPVSVISVTFNKTGVRQIIRTAEEAENILKARAKEAEKQAFADAEITERNETVSESAQKDSLVLTVKYKIRRKIGREKALTFEYE